MFIIEKKQGCHVDVQYGAKNDLSVIRSQMLKRLEFTSTRRRMFSPEQSVEIVSTRRALPKLGTELACDGRERGGIPHSHCSCVVRPGFSLGEVLNLFALIHRKMYK